MTFFLEVLVWQKTKDGQRRSPRNKPKLYTPDFMKKKPKEAAITRESELHTVDDIKQILDRPRG